MSEQLYLLEIRPSACDLIRYAGGQGINRAQDEDLGYALHSWLAALFGKLAPKPFRLIQRKDGGLQLLAYSKHSKAQLICEAQSAALPSALSVCDLALHFHQKPMPGTWLVGQRLGFELLACPITRKEQAEKDVFLRRCDTLEEGQGPLSRESVYLEWLKTQFGKAVDLEEAKLTGFRLVQLLRRTHKAGSAKKTQHLTHPQALFQGSLRVEDCDAFHSLLLRGIGRHRAFGYGMILLRHI